MRSFEPRVNNYHRKYRNNSWLTWNASMGGWAVSVSALFFQIICTVSGADEEGSNPPGRERQRIHHEKPIEIICSWIRCLYPLTELSSADLYFVYIFLSISWSALSSAVSIFTIISFIIFGQAFFYLIFHYLLPAQKYIGNNMSEAIWHAVPIFYSFISLSFWGPHNRFADKHRPIMKASIRNSNINKGKIAFDDWPDATAWWAVRIRFS